MIIAKDLSFSYDDYAALEDVNFEISDKEFVGVIGPNGGGKTTLLKLLLGLIRPQKGTLTIRDKEPALMRHILAYVPQYSTMDKDFPISVAEVVAMGLLNRRSLSPWISHADQEKVHAVLRLLHIETLAKKTFGKLSGGQQQRTLIARALVSDPDWLLLDEPTASIDSSVEEDLYDLFQRLNEKMGIVLVTHDLGVVSSLVKKVICVNRQLECNTTVDMDWKSMVEKSYHHSVKPIVHSHEF